jgi:hypothetical protein
MTDTKLGSVTEELRQVPHFSLEGSSLEYWSIDITVRTSDTTFVNGRQLCCKTNYFTMNAC